MLIPTNRKTKGKENYYEDAGGEGMGGAVGGEGDEGGLGGGVLGLAEGGAVIRALEIISVEVYDSFEARRVVWTLSYAGVRR